MKFDIFISYRREGGYETAKHLNDLLVRDGYKVSFDIDTLRSGNFDTQLLKRIEQCKDFILIVDQHAFDRTLNPNFDPKSDWVRQELAHALRHKKNIIPVFLAGVSAFPENLPDDIIGVTKMHSPVFNKFFFNDFYKNLKSNFLTSQSRKKRVLYTLIAAVLLGGLFMLQGKEDTIFYQNPSLPSSTTHEEFDLYAKTDLQKAIVGTKLEPSDSSMIVQQWQMESNDQNAKAQYSLGLCYYTGYVVRTDKAEAIKYFKKAATQNLAEAQFALAICYRNGIGINTSTSKAIKLLQMSAEQDFAPAQYNYGVMLFEGNNMNVPEAVKWLTASAEQGYAPAQYALAFCYANNMGVMADIDKAEYWLEEAAEQNYDIAKYNLASLYITGPDNYRDSSSAIEILEELADCQYPAALNDLGYYYVFGFNVDKDINKGISMIQQAAEYDYAPALSTLGCWYFNPQFTNIEQDFKKGLEYLLKAAEQGFPGAQYYLGVAYQNGYGVKPSLSKAKKWYNLAADQGVTTQSIQNQNQATLQLINQ